jgi:hypothetical protein
MTDVPLEITVQLKITSEAANFFTQTLGVLGMVEAVL